MNEQLQKALDKIEDRAGRKRLFLANADTVRLTKVDIPRMIAVLRLYGQIASRSYNHTPIEDCSCPACSILREKMKRALAELEDLT